MVDFGDELTIDNYRIPWLIWIQLLVLVLLIFLLFCFSFLASDHSDRTSDSPSTSHLVFQETQKEKNPIPKRNPTTVVANRLEIAQVGEQVIKGEIATGNSRRLVRGEDITEWDGSSATPTYHHPCDYFRLARLAFLKCLGLDFSTEKRKEPRKRRES